MPFPIRFEEAAKGFLKARLGDYTIWLRGPSVGGERWRWHVTREGAELRSDRADIRPEAEWHALRWIREYGRLPPETLTCLDDEITPRELVSGPGTDGECRPTP